MSYTKQTHVAGQKLTAAQLNHMENGIVAAQNAYNLLDNSDFRIAQAGYGGMHGTAKYACDRWLDRYGFGVFSFDESKGLTISYGTNHAYATQRIDNASRYHGKAMTLAVGMADGTVHIKSGEWLSNTTSFAIYFDNATFYLYTNSVELVVTEGSLSVKWIALYEGSYTAETLPLYVPKGYEAELAECQRYYENSWFNSTKSIENEYMGVCVHTSGLDAIIEYKVPKRIAATVTFYPTSPSETWRVYNDGGYRPLASVEAYARNGVRSFMVRGMKDTVNDTSAWTHGKAILLFGQWEASADL